MSHQWYLSVPACACLQTVSASRYLVVFQTYLRLQPVPTILGYITGLSAAANWTSGLSEEATASDPPVIGQPGPLGAARAGPDEARCSSRAVSGQCPEEQARVGRLPLALMGRVGDAGDATGAHADAETRAGRVQIRWPAASITIEVQVSDRYRIWNKCLRLGVEAGTRVRQARGSHTPPWNQPSSTRTSDAGTYGIQCLLDLWLMTEQYTSIIHEVCSSDGGRGRETAQKQAPEPPPASRVWRDWTSRIARSRSYPGQWAWRLSSLTNVGRAMPRRSNEKCECIWISQPWPAKVPPVAT